MYVANIVKQAVISNKGILHLTDGTKPEQYNNFGILLINKNRYVVTLPKESNEPIPGIKTKYTGMLWKIDIKDSLPILTSHHFHYFSQSGLHLKAAVKAFNRYYKDSEYEPGEIIEMFTINSM